MNRPEGWDQVWAQAQESPFVNPRAENNGCNEIGHPSTIRRNIMTESTPQTPETVADESLVEKEPTRLQKFVCKHPRAAKVAAITGSITAVAGVAITANTMRKNKHHLDQAAEHAKEALYEVSESVSPTDTDN